MRGEFVRRELLGVNTPSGSNTKLPAYQDATWPDGALRSSVHDVGRFLSTILHGGAIPGSHGGKERRILREDSVSKMLAPLATDSDGVGTGVFWETGFTDTGRTVTGHSGSDFGFTSLMYFDPATAVGIVLLVNADTERFAEVFEPALIEQWFQHAEYLHSKR
ncbi:MAG: serine hydrolase [Myxococcales bacterium]